MGTKIIQPDDAAKVHKVLLHQRIDAMVLDLHDNILLCRAQLSFVDLCVCVCVRVCVCVCKCVA